MSLFWQVRGGFGGCDRPEPLLGCRTCAGSAPRFARLYPRAGASVISSRSKQARGIVVVIAAFFLAVGGATADPGTVASKRAQAEQVLSQINQIDNSLERAIQAYDGANWRLGKIERQQRENRHELMVAKSNLKHAQAALSTRLVAIYTSDQDNTTLDVILGAKNLDAASSPRAALRRRTSRRSSGSAARCSPRSRGRSRSCRRRSTGASSRSRTPPRRASSRSRRRSTASSASRARRPRAPPSCRRPRSRAASWASR